MPDEFEPVYSLKEVAAILSRGGMNIRERSIRTEIANGRTRRNIRGGKLGVLRSDLTSYLQKARRCQDGLAPQDLSY